VSARMRGLMAAGVALVLAAGLVTAGPGWDAVTFWRHPTTTITAHFTRAVGLYPGSQVRVTSKSKNDLQAAIAACKDHDFGIALQFTNYR